MILDRFVKMSLMMASTLIATGILSPVAWADQASIHKFERKVVLSCARSRHIALPKNGSALSPTDRANMHSCARQFRIDLRTCATKAGIAQTASMAPAQIPAYRACQKQAFAQIH